MGRDACRSAPVRNGCAARGAHSRSHDSAGGRRSESFRRRPARCTGCAPDGAILNIERVYTTSKPAEEVAQVFSTTDSRTVMQARKDSLWRQALGVAYAVTVIIARKEGQLVVDLGE